MNDKLKRIHGEREMTKPMSDERLREIETDSVNLHSYTLRQELVDEIRRLRAEVERLENKLERYEKILADELLDALEEK